MKPLRHTLTMTIRPRPLVVAARYAMQAYQRDTMLPRIMGLTLRKPVAPSADVLDHLIAQEAAMEQARKTHAASWRAADHVLLMAALMTEAQLLDMPACQAVALE